MRILQVEVLIFPSGLEGCVAGGIVAAPSLANSTEAVLLGRPDKSSCNLSSRGVVFGTHLRNTPCLCRFLSSHRDKKSLQFETGETNNNSTYNIKNKKRLGLRWRLW